MSSVDRWSQIEDLFGALFEMPVEERQRALEAVEDADLRAEVGTLLTTHQGLMSSDGDFLEGLDSAQAAALLERSRSPEEDLPTIGRYRIVRRLARGGMGIVYLAHDPRLNRPVALKLLPLHLSADPAAVRRLGDEARAASALDHPNIQTVYEIGETADGRVFIAMAYYDGETLRERIGHGPMPVPEVMDLGVQLAEGLSAAHRCGILHRDIKPENILVTRDDVLKIVDFGVAKVTREGLATADLPLGTAAYMSPEQTRGEALDHRTDLWSMGVVLYEMLVGARPFGGEGEALIHAIRNDPPRPWSAGRRDLPPPLVVSVERCLEKNPARRYQTTQAVAQDLRDVLWVAAGPARRSRPGLPTGRRVGRQSRLVVVAATAAVLVTGLMMRSDGETAGPLAVGAAPGIAVLPFDVRGEGVDIWREGMVDLLSIGLDGGTVLRAIDSRTVLAHWREAVEEGGAPDLAGALEIARGMGARYAVLGSIVSSDPGMRVSATVFSLDDGKTLASFHEDGSPDSIYALVDRLSIDILAATWQGKEQPTRDVDLTRITTASMPALKAYLEGESLLRRADFEGAAVAYERAIAADSTFAFAQFHLGQAYSWMEAEEYRRADARRAAALRTSSLSIQAFQHALSHSDRLPEREALLLRGTLAYYTATPDLPTAVELLETVTQKYPDDPDAWYLLGDAYFHRGKTLLVAQNESEKAFRKAFELDPGFGPVGVHLVHNAFILYADSSRAARLIDIYYGLAPDSRHDHENRIAFGLAFGDTTRRRQAFAALDTLPPDRLYGVAEWFLDHPRFLDQREAVLKHRTLPTTSPGPQMAAHLFDSNLSQGKLQTALSDLEEPPSVPRVRAAGLYTAHTAGLPVPRGLLDQALALPPADGQDEATYTLLTFYAGAYAADRERWTDHASALRRLRAQAGQLLAAGDSVSSRFVMGASLALQGQALWRRGDAARALPLLMDGQRQTPMLSENRGLLNDTIRWWLGELLLEMGRPLDAAVYFESFWNDPLAAWRLGLIYEEVGDRAKARDAYALVAFAWADADSGLQARVREARAAVQRLTRSDQDWRGSRRPGANRRLGASFEDFRPPLAPLPGLSQLGARRTRIGLCGGAPQPLDPGNRRRRRGCLRLDPQYVAGADLRAMV